MASGPMDKNWKLSRYDRKDYTELVDFPVEIVGRDGVVRRYTFEDSIRLYQKRITSASNRYRDGDLARAEVNHCQSRIDQLRRSYFHRYGWGTPLDGGIARASGSEPAPDGVSGDLVDPGSFDGSGSDVTGEAPLGASPARPVAERVFGDLAGEVAAFLCRSLGVDGRPDLTFDFVADDVDGASLWYIRRHGLPRPETGMLLYFYRFEAPEPATEPSEPSPSHRFFRRLKDLERMARPAGDGGDVERLLAFHHTADCGFVLTGRAADYHELQPAREEGHQPVDLAPTPWDEVLEIVRKGDYEAALRRCRDLVAEQPYHRNAYVAGAMIASHLGESVAGEDLALIGSRYFPKDPAIRYYLGACLLRQGRSEEGERALREALSLAPDLAAARALLVVHLLRAPGRLRGLPSPRVGEARALLQARRGVVPDDRRVEADLALLEQWLRWRAWTTAAGAALAIAGVLSLLVVGVAGLLLAAPGAAVVLLGQMAFRHELQAIQNRHRFEEISQGLRRLHRRSRAALPDS